MRWKRAEYRTGYGPRSRVNPDEMFNSGTDPTLIARQLVQKRQERRMYLAQQQYSRESEERTNVFDQGNLRSSLESVLPNEQYNTMAQCPAPNSSVHPGSTPAQDSRPTAPSDVVASRPATSNQETANNEQIDRRHNLLMEVLSQFENRSVDYAKRNLDSDNGVAFDWGKLPRIGSVHSVQGIVGPEIVQMPTRTAGTNERWQPPSKRRKIKVSELAQLILNGTFDSFLDLNSPEGQSSANHKTTTENVNGGNESSNQVSVVQRQVLDPRMGSSSQGTALNSGSANDTQSYRDNTQQQTTATQMTPSFNPSTTRVEKYSSNYASHTPNRNSVESCGPQSTPRTMYNTNSVNTNGSGNFAAPSIQRTSSNTLYPNRPTGYNTSSGHPVTTGGYINPSNGRTIYNANASNLAVSTSRSYNLQSNQRPRYNTGTTSYNTSRNHQNVSHMVNGQTPGVYGPTPVRASYPRSLTSVPRSAPYIRHPLNSIPMGISFPSAGRISAGRQHIPSSLRDARSVDRAARTARVEPLSNPTNVVQPSPRANHVITSNMSSTTSSSTNVCSPERDLTKNDEHDENSCLDCKLLGTCPIKKAIAAEKEKELEDSSDDELIITKVTTKDAERGPIERIDVDEWCSSSSCSESVSEPVKVKQEPADKEEVVPIQEQKNSDINNIVNQMRLMAERLLTDDSVLDLGTTNRNEENSVDKDSNADSSSIQDSVSDNSAVCRPQVATSGVASAQEGRESDTMSRQATTEGAEGQDGTRVCQEASSEDIVTENNAGQDCVNMDTNVASEVAEEITQENVSEHINVDVQNTAEADATSNVQEDIASITMEIQTPSQGTKESLAQNPVTEDDTMDVQLGASVPNQESVDQDCVAEGVSMDTHPVSPSIGENLQQDHITIDTRAVSPSTSGVTGIEDVTKRHEASDRHLGSLIKKVKSIERCISFLRERATSASDSAESEYDKGDRNYQKYLSMEGADVTNQENDKTSLNTPGHTDNLYTASRGVSSRQPSQTEMSLHDKEAVANLERQLEENQEKLRQHTDNMSMRKKYLQERLFILRKIERISQKYELMNWRDREVLDKLEKSLEINLEKFKTQNVTWIRKNCLKARLKILKKIERIYRGYKISPEEPLVLDDGEESRKDLYNLSTIKGVETEIAWEANATVPVHANNALPTAVQGQETCQSTKTADALGLPGRDAGIGRETQHLFSEADDHSVEEVEESTSGCPVTDLNNETATEERDSVAFEETNPLSEPAANDDLFGNVIVKSEGIVQDSNVREVFTLEDAINTFVEEPEEGHCETFGERTSGPPTPNDPSEWAPPAQTNNQENGMQGHSENSSLKTTPNSSMEHLPLINCDEIVESTLPENEPQSKQLGEIEDLSEETIIIVTDRSIQTDRNNVPRFPRSFHQTSSTEEFGQGSNVDDAGESPSKRIEIENLSDEITLTVTDIGIQTDRNNVPRSFNQSSSTEKLGQGISVHDAGESRAKGILRKEKRKRDTTEEHVVIKKEKIDSEQDETLQNEEKYNIWDFINKYSR